MMSVTLTDEQFGTVMRTMVFIAGGRFTNRRGHEQRISRDRLVEEARAACSFIGWPFRGDGTGFRGFHDERNYE